MPSPAPACEQRPRCAAATALPQAELGADSPVWELVRRDAIHELLTQDWLPNSKSKFLFNFLCVKLFLEELGT